jgi:ketosteroid isomerase-like protein
MNDDQRYIWNGVLTMYEGFIEKNRPKIDQFIHEDCTVWDSSERDLAFGLKGLNEIRARRPQDPSAPQVERIDATDPVITIYGDMAVARHYLKVVYVNNASPTREVRNTGVWKKFDQGWQLVHNHEDELPLAE